MDGGWTERRVGEIKGTEKKIKGLFDAVHHHVCVSWSRGGGLGTQTDLSFLLPETDNEDGQDDSSASNVPPLNSSITESITQSGHRAPNHQLSYV